MGSADEIAEWVNVLPMLGPSGVAQNIQSSSEYRTDVVTTYYNDLLSRPPDAAGLSGWVFSNLDLRTVRVGFEGSLEYYNDYSRASAAVLLSWRATISPCKRPGNKRGQISRVLFVFRGRPDVRFLPAALCVNARRAARPGAAFRNSGRFPGVGRNPAAGAAIAPPAYAPCVFSTASSTETQPCHSPAARPACARRSGRVWNALKAGPCRPPSC